MTECVKQQICIKPCIKFKHSSVETIQMIQKSAAMGNGDWQLHHNKVPAHTPSLVQRFLENIKSPRWLSPTTAQIWCPVTSGFSQNYNHLWKGRYFRPSMRFRKIWWDSWWQLGELCEVPRCLLWRGLRCHCPVYSDFCTLYLLQEMSVLFLVHGSIPSGQTSFYIYGEREREREWTHKWKKGKNKKHYPWFENHLIHNTG